MKKLIAKIPILYQGRMYAEGEALPAYDHKMVDAWTRAKSAEFIDTNKTASHDTSHAGVNPPDPNGHQEPPESPKGEGEPSGEPDTPKVEEEPSGIEGEDSVVLQEGYLTRADLEKMEKDDLKALAKQLGVELPRGAAKTLIIEKLTAVAVNAPADDGAAQK